MLRVKDSFTAFLLLLSILHEIQEYTCFRIRDFNVPATVTSGSPVFLRCQFDLEKDKLVNLKWYFNDKEFLRFEPKSKREETQIFHLPVLSLEKSNVVNSADKGSWIRLSHVTREMSGRYRCEVTIESLFFTMTKEGYMNVVPPTTTTSTESYPPVYHHRPSKQLDVDAVEEEPPSAEVLNPNNGSSRSSQLLHTTLIVSGLLLVMHWPTWIV